MAYKLAPHVPLLVVKDQAGRNHHCYHHNTAVIPWLSDEQRETFLRLGLVEEIPDKEAEKLAPADTVRPAKTAPAAKWVDYGVAQGHDRAELEALDKPDLVELLG